MNEVVAHKFGIRRGYKYIVSVGSVGQPRDYDNRAVLRHLRHRRAAWSSSTASRTTSRRAAQKIFDADLALNFGKRLFLGV